MFNKKILSVAISIFSIISIQGCGGGSAQDEVTSPANPNTLVITQQPTDASIIIGQKATFSISLDNSTSVSYQWLKNQSPISGATKSSYSIDAVGITDDNSAYSVRLTNATTSLTSQSAKLTVISKNVIAEHLGGKSIDSVEYDRVDGSLLGVDAQGAAYILKQGMRVVKLSQDGTQLPFGDAPNGVQVAQIDRSNTTPCLYKQAGGTVDAQGNVYVWHNTSEAFPVNGCNLTGGAIHKISSDGKTNTVLVQSTLSEPVVPLSVHLGSAGDVYFRNAWGSKLFKINSNGTMTSVSNMGYETPRYSYFPNNPTEIPEVAIGDADQIYLSSYLNGQFFKLDADGKLIPLPGANVASGQSPVLLDRIGALHWNPVTKKLLALSLPGILPSRNPDIGPGMLLAIDPSTTTVTAIAGLPTAGVDDKISVGFLPGKLGGVTRFIYGFDGNIYAEEYVSAGVIKVYKIIP